MSVLDTHQGDTLFDLISFRDLHPETTKWEANASKILSFVAHRQASHGDLPTVGVVMEYCYHGCGPGHGA